MKSIQPVRFALCTALLALCACVSPPPPLPENLTLQQAMELEGTAEVLSSTVSKQCVVIIRDRHPTYRGYRRIRKQLVQVQRSNRRFLDYLVRNGFTLLGCEFPRGPLEENSKTRQSYQLVRSKSRYGPEYLDRFAVYQPVRYQLFWPNRLQVIGVEDPILYEADRSILKEFQRIRQTLILGGLRPEERVQLEAATARAAAKLRVNSDRRGEAAAKNLLLAMQDATCYSAVLLLGGVHVPEAQRQLEAAGVQVHVFRPNGYETTR